MKQQARMIVVGVAMLACLFFVYMMWNLKPKVVQAPVMDQQIRSTKVLVAKRDINLGEVTAPDVFRWQEWPEGAVNPAYITESRRPNAMRDFDKRIARAPLLAGEPVTDAKLIRHDAGGVMSAILPAGMRAIATKIRDETAAGKLILPNDYVDVILIQRKRGRGAGGGEEFVSDTLFRNVRVLAIGQTIEVKEGNKKSAEGGTATLELTPRQSELLALANAMGEISLSLRSVADINTAAGPGNRENRAGNSIRVLRYGVKSRAYGVN
jgi:pilus assembly protein CpaB